MKELLYKRIVLKLSGESLKSQDNPLDPSKCKELAKAIANCAKLGVEIAVVLGGGNIWRGAKGQGTSIARGPSDQMGMIATCINSLLLKEYLIQEGIEATCMSAIAGPSALAPFEAEKAKKLLEEGQVLLLAGGSGNPYFSTDTAAALRANEIEAQVLFKATKVDGVYDKDPIANKDAKRFARLSFEEALNMRVELMDMPSFALCMENQLPIRVFSFSKGGSLQEALTNPDFGTLVS